MEENKYFLVKEVFLNPESHYIEILLEQLE